MRRTGQTRPTPYSHPVSLTKERHKGLWQLAAEGSNCAGERAFRGRLGEVGVGRQFGDQLSPHGYRMPEAASQPDRSDVPGPMWSSGPRSWTRVFQYGPAGPPDEPARYPFAAGGSDPDCSR